MKGPETNSWVGKIVNTKDTNSGERSDEKEGGISPPPEKRDGKTRKWRLSIFPQGAASQGLKKKDLKR